MASDQLTQNLLLLALDRGGCQDRYQHRRYRRRRREHPCQGNLTPLGGQQDVEHPPAQHQQDRQTGARYELEPAREEEGSPAGGPHDRQSLAEQTRQPPPIDPAILVPVAIEDGESLFTGLRSIRHSTPAPTSPITNSAIVIRYQPNTANRCCSRYETSHLTAVAAETAAATNPTSGAATPKLSMMIPPR